MDQATELTLRDVLQQIDRRLTAVEEGLRAQSAAMVTLAKELRAEIAESTRELRAEIAKSTRELRAEIFASAKELRAEAKDTETNLRAEIQALRAEMSTGFRWIVGLILVSWLSTMGMMLPILLRQGS